MRSVPFSRRDALRAAAGAAVGAIVLRDASPASAAAAVQRFYLGTYTGTGGKGIAKGRLDPATGALTIDSWQKSVADPSWLELSADRKTLYSVSELSPGGLICGLKLSAGGDPGPAASKPSGAAPTHMAIHPGGKYLFTALYGGGAVAVHPILTDGSVGAATDVHKHTAPGRTSHAHQVVVDPSGQYLLAVDLGLDAVIVYTLNTVTGKLTETSRTALKTGSGPRHLAFHPSKPVAYIANELDSTLTVCGWAGGKLTPQPQPLPTAPAGVINYPGEVVVSPSGRYVYVSNRGHNSIAVFSASPDGTSLQRTGTPSCGGVWPRHLAIDSSGKWIYAVNQTSGDVTWFPLSAATGLPGAAAGKLSTPSVAHLRLT